MNIIDAHNINYNISGKSIFHKLDLSIELGSFVSLIGENGSGKTTLLKILTGQIITDARIKIDNIKVNKYNIEEISKRIAVINSYNEFFSKTVMEEILQDRRQVSVYDVNKVRKLLDSFDLLYLEKMPVQNLSYAENQIIALIKAIIKNPRIIILDNAFSKLDIDKREELLNYLTSYCKTNKITIISATNNISELKYFDRVILIKYSNIFFDGSYKELINTVDLNKENLNYPWAVEVSNKLKLYDLMDKDLDDIDQIVGELCK
ncbi:MAG: energy-coupling factor ABC transporter ATP-binding protein [Bacilli bacterium]|nr:energy-coupling factor ABC transporter ATP-binding protein [Bacilli bacterium]